MLKGEYSTTGFPMLLSRSLVSLILTIKIDDYLHFDYLASSHPAPPADGHKLAAAGSEPVNVQVWYNLPISSASGVVGAAQMPQSLNLKMWLNIKWRLPVPKNKSSCHVSVEFVYVRGIPSCASLASCVLLQGEIQRRLWFTYMHTYDVWLHLKGLGYVNNIIVWNDVFSVHTITFLIFKNFKNSFKNN